MDLPVKNSVAQFFKAIFVPFLSMHHILSVTYPRNKFMNMLTTGTYTVFFYTALAVLFASPSNSSLVGFGWSFFLSAGILLGVVRNGFRDRFNLHSTIMADFFASSFLWPQVFAQMMVECDVQGLPNDKSEDELRLDDVEKEPMAAEQVEIVEDPLEVSEHEA